MEVKVTSPLETYMNIHSSFQRQALFGTVEILQHHSVAHHDLKGQADQLN